MKMDVECGLSEPFVECGRGEGSFSGRKCSSTFYARRLRAPCSPIGVAVIEEALRSLLSKDGPDADKRGKFARRHLPYSTDIVGGHPLGRALAWAERRRPLVQVRTSTERQGGLRA
jgi:hypothetical protein